MPGSFPLCWHLIHSVVWHLRFFKAQCSLHFPFGLRILCDCQCVISNFVCPADSGCIKNKVYPFPKGIIIFIIYIFSSSSLCTAGFCSADWNQLQIDTVPNQNCFCPCKWHMSCKSHLLHKSILSKTWAKLQMFSTKLEENGGMGGVRRQKHLDISSSVANTPVMSIQSMVTHGVLRSYTLNPRYSLSLPL